MNDNKLYIKNMVCNRCVMVVRDELQKLGLRPLSVELGTVQFPEPVNKDAVTAIKNALEPLGFELIDDKRFRLIEQVKSLIIKLVHEGNNNLKINLSDYLADKLHHDYGYISNLFSEFESTTIEQYFIAQKVERVKELLVYDELSLGEIADLVNYSSSAHLSAQFKKVTGFTPSHFKKIKGDKRKPLDKVK